MKNNLILLVEDNRAEEILMLQALRRNNVISEIIVARDGAEALSLLFPQESPSFQLNAQPSVVLLDLNLPKVDGLEVLRRIRSHDSTRMLPVIILSSSDLSADIQNSYMLGANSYVRKMINFEQFSEAVNQLTRYWLKLNEAPPVSAFGSGVPGTRNLTGRTF